MRKPMLAGNWKMNKTNAELPGFFETFTAETGLAADRSLLDQVEVMFAVPFTLLAKTVETCRAYGIRVGAQNVHWEESGAFTGEVSLPMLRELGVTDAVIGHSERRQYFAENDEAVAKKTVACLNQEIRPIVCVGETLEERDAGRTSEVVTQQVKTVLDAISETRDLVIAYEPVWAIGTGRSATSDQAQEVHQLIRGLVDEKFGKGPAEAVRILYGGSAKPANIEELLAQPDIDGGLVGGASLKPSDFAKMVKAGAGKGAK